MGPLWLERKNGFSIDPMTGDQALLQWGRSGWSGRTRAAARRCPSRAARHCFNGAALVGAEEHYKILALPALAELLQWGRSGWSGRTPAPGELGVGNSVLQWGRSGWSGRTGGERGVSSEVLQASMGPLWLERKNGGGVEWG